MAAKKAAKKKAGASRSRGNGRAKAATKNVAVEATVESLIANSHRLPEAKVITDLHKKLENLQKDVTAASLAMGQAVEKAVETKNVNKKAFAIARSLNNLSDEKLPQVLAHLYTYIEHFGLVQRATQQLTMKLEERAADPQTDIEDAPQQAAGDDEGDEDGPSSPAISIAPKAEASPIH